MRMVLHFAEDLVPRFGPQIVDVVERFVESLDGDPLDHDALEDEGGAQHAAKSGLQQICIQFI